MADARVSVAPKAGAPGPPGHVRIDHGDPSSAPQTGPGGAGHPDRARTDNQYGITGGDADRLDGMQPHGVGLNEGGVQGIDGAGHGKG